MKLSVIIPTYNCESTLNACLKAIQTSSRKADEIIVIDDGSTDNTSQIAKKYTKQVINLSHQGRNTTRLNGFNLASGDIIINIDSDVLIKKNTLHLIEQYFKTHKNVDAITGKLALHSQLTGFFSQYKNMYMNYIFSLQPTSVTFIYGSIFAIRKDIKKMCATNYNFTEDTAIGQNLIKNNKVIHLLKELSVYHLKNITLFQFLKNDFLVPFYWTKVFLEFQGFSQLGKNKTGFAHASKSQLASIIISGIMVLFFFSIYILSFRIMLLYQLIACFLWSILNYKFLKFIKKNSNLKFFILSIPTTWIDNIIMLMGLTCGFFCHIKYIKKS